MSRERKHVFGVSDQVQHKPGCTATDDGQRVNDEYITVVIVPGYLLRSTKECKLGYFMGVPGSRLNFSHSLFLVENFASCIDAVLETGSAWLFVKSA